MEEIGLGRHLRDSLVNTIWEGTTNVLAMDVLRVFKQTKNKAFDIFEKVTNISSLTSERIFK